MERNHNVQVGDIFFISSTDEVSHNCSFVEVVRLKGKTMVEYSVIQQECYVDDTCNDALSECSVRPLPGQFRDREQFFSARVYRSALDGEECLCQPGKCGKLMYPYNEEKCRCSITGYAGAYARDRMGTEKRLIL